MASPLQPLPGDTGLIHGQKAGSKPEWNVAIALVRLGWSFDYQLSYFGGRTIAGGMVLDFLVSTLPDPTPIFVQGEYWHSGARQEVDALQLANMRQQFSGRIRNPILLQASDAATAEQAYNTLLGELGKAT